MPGWLRFFCIALLLTPQYTPQAFAQIYTWTDENGSVHFTDEPPVNQPVDQVELRQHNTLPMTENVRRQQRALRESSSTSPDPHPRSSRREADRKALRQERERAKCNAYREKIKHTDSRLRAGSYSVSQGNRLRAQRRELQGKLAWECLRDR